ncbi:MAG: hypothetical protein ACE5FD_16425, partial [Anaerolineae bacterium]
MMSWPRFDPFLYRQRCVLSACLLLIIGYFLGFTWLTLPSLTVVLGWQPETTFTVLPDVEHSYGDVLQPGDVILAVDGRPVKRGELIFSPPVKSVYQLTLQRDGEVVETAVSTANSRLFHLLNLTVGGLTLAFWVLGFLTLYFARPGQNDALWSGLAWQLVGAGIARRSRKMLLLEETIRPRSR